MTRHISDDGLALIKQFEGLYLKAYHGAADRPGLLTIGYGHTDAAGPPVVSAGMTITEAQANDILRSDLWKCEASVEQMVKVDLNDNQFAALVSFVFNCGETNFRSSSLLRKLNAGNYNAVPSELMKWTRANGKQVQGLVNRRSAEAGLWAKGSFVASQFIDPEPDNKSTLLNPENIASGTGVVSALGAFSSGPGPIQWALAFGMIIAFALGGYFLFLRIRDSHA